MKKIIAFLICLCTVLSVGTMVAVGGYERVFYYYEQRYREGKMKNGPGSVIGDPNCNKQIDAEDALRVLFFIKHGGAHVNPYFETVATTPEEMRKQEAQCLNYLEGLSLNYYRRGWHLIDWEKKNWQGQLGGSFINDYFFQSYVRNAYFLCDVSNDCQVGADDALIILQYVVGKRESFPRTDYTGKGAFQYMYPIEEWYPTQYWDVRVRHDGQVVPNAYDSVADIFPDIPPMPAK